MPAIGNIVLADAEATPVNHTFTPVTTNGAKASLANRVASTIEGFELLGIEVKQPITKQGAYQVIATLYDPTEVTVDGVPVVDSFDSFELKFNLSKKSTAQRRKNLLKMAASLATNSTFASVVENVEPIY